LFHTQSYFNKAIHTIKLKKARLTAGMITVLFLLMMEAFEITHSRMDKVVAVLLASRISTLMQNVGINS
jgi:hypothetical protein